MTRHTNAATEVMLRMKTNPDWARQVRLRAKLSLADLGKLCDVSEATISRWERGKNVPNDTQFGVYASYLDKWGGNNPVQFFADAFTCPEVECDWLPEGRPDAAPGSPEAVSIQEQFQYHQKNCLWILDAQKQLKMASQNVSVVPISKADGSPRRFMLRCDSCLSVPKGEFTETEAQALATGHSCADTVDLGAPSEVSK